MTQLSFFTSSHKCLCDFCWGEWCVLGSHLSDWREGVDTWKPNLEVLQKARRILHQRASAGISLSSVSHSHLHISPCALTLVLWGHWCLWPYSSEAPRRPLNPSQSRIFTSKSGYLGHLLGMSYNRGDWLFRTTVNSPCRNRPLCCIRARMSSSLPLWLGDSSTAAGCKTNLSMWQNMHVWTYINLQDGSLLNSVWECWEEEPK